MQNENHGASPKLTTTARRTLRFYENFTKLKSHFLFNRKGAKFAKSKYDIFNFQLQRHVVSRFGGSRIDEAN